MVHRSEEARQKELQKIQDYRNLVSVTSKKVHISSNRWLLICLVLLINIKQRQEHNFSEDALATVSELLLKNPEYYTLWNNRREILQHLFSEADGQDKVQRLIQGDLEFLFPLLKQFPKCYWIWNHRLWVLQQATQRLALPDAQKLWQHELALVGKMLSLDSRNFHGWGYRRVVVAEIESLNRQSSGEDAPKADKKETSMAQAELDYTTKMIGTNLSNFSAWHNRSQLILRLLSERSANDENRKKMLDDGMTLFLVQYHAVSPGF